MTTMLVPSVPRRLVGPLAMIETGRSLSGEFVIVCPMTKRLHRMPTVMRIMPLLVAIVSPLLPLESSALTRQNLHCGSLFASEWETCRNDPVNNSDPLGLETVDEQITALEQRNQQYIQKVSRAAKITEVALNTAVDVSPVGNVIAITQGTDASGERLSWWEKGLVAVPALATLRSANRARKTVREIRALSKIRSEMRAGSSAETGFVNGWRALKVADVPLPESVLRTFSGNKAVGSMLEADTVLYRVSGGSAGRVGSYLTRRRPSSVQEAVQKLALDPKWEVEGVHLVEVRVPRGTVVWEGTVASQGVLPGGANQVWISPEQLSENWFNLIKW